MSGYQLIKPFMRNPGDNTASYEQTILSGRAQHNETLTKLGDLYYTRKEDLEREKAKKYPDQARIARLERIIEDNKKYAPYATMNQKSRTR